LRQPNGTAENFSGMLPQQGRRSMVADLLIVEAKGADYILYRPGRWMRRLGDRACRGMVENAAAARLRWFAI